MESKIKRIIAILLAVCFLVTVAATAVSAEPDKLPSYLVHNDNGDNGGSREGGGQNNGQGNLGTPGYYNQQGIDQPGQRMGSSYSYNL